MKAGLYILGKYFLLFFLISEGSFLFTNYLSDDWQNIKANHLISNAVIVAVATIGLVWYHYSRLRKAGQSGFTFENIKLNQVREIEFDGSINTAHEILVKSPKLEHMKIELQSKKIEIELATRKWSSWFVRFFLEKENDKLKIHYSPLLHFSVMDFGEAFYRVNQIVEAFKSEISPDS